jgi:hypothetical protein
MTIQRYPYAQVPAEVARHIRGLGARLLNFLCEAATYLIQWAQWFEDYGYDNEATALGSFVLAYLEGVMVVKPMHAPPIVERRRRGRRRRLKRQLRIAVTVIATITIPMLGLLYFGPMP